MRRVASLWGPGGRRFKSCLPELVEAAQNLFLERGYDSTTVDETPRPPD